MVVPVQWVLGGGAIDPSARIFAGVTINEGGHSACGMISLVAAQKVPKGLHGGSLFTVVLEGV